MALVLAIPAIAQSPASVTGRWEGGYVGQDMADANTLVVNLEQSGTRVSGGMVELNTFGDASKNLFLTSTIEGTVTGRDVVFVKTYDGSGGVTHSVRYSGTISPDGRRIQGEYVAAGARGAFEFAR
jgi:hypothetical protein